MDMACISDPFPVAVVSCLATGRAPAPGEVEEVAERIWRDGNPGGQRWKDLRHDGRDRGRMMRAATVALGQLR